MVCDHRHYFFSYFFSVRLDVSSFMEGADRVPLRRVAARQ
jgi:hypothetical protein